LFGDSEGMTADLEEVLTPLMVMSVSGAYEIVLMVKGTNSLIIDKVGLREYVRTGHRF
jgi:hypothetical protein